MGIDKIEGSKDTKRRKLDTDIYGYRLHTKPLYSVSSGGSLLIRGMLSGCSVGLKTNSGLTEDAEGRVSLLT